MMPCLVNSDNDTDTDNKNIYTYLYVHIDASAIVAVLRKINYPGTSISAFYL